MAIRTLMTQIRVLLPAIAIGALSSPAFADASNDECTPAKVSWAQDSSTGSMVFSFVCNDRWIYAHTQSPSCPTLSVDTLKSWLSIAMAAQLSGKLVHVKFRTIPDCSYGDPEIYVLELWT